MNTKQAETVVELASQGFHKEALSLARAYIDTTDLESREVLASDDALSHLNSVLHKILSPFMRDGILGKILGGIAQRMFSIKLTASAIKSIIFKTTLILTTVVAIISPFLLYLLVQKVEEHAKNTNWVPRNVSYNPAQQKAVYATMVEDNLRDLKQKVQRMMNQ